MRCLVDVVDKIENSVNGSFFDINNDLGLFIEKNLRVMGSSQEVAEYTILNSYHKY